jgi:hypothetical protein
MTLIRLFVLLIVITAAIILFDPFNLRQVAPISIEDEASLIADNQKYNTISEAWDWDRVQVEKTNNKTQNQSNMGGLPFSPQEVYQALQAIKIDAEGNVVLDHDAKLSLDEALERIYSVLNSNSMSTLKQLIQDALPGLTGEQVSQLVENYTNYLLAKDDFSKLYESITPPADEVSLASVRNDELLYSELKALRQTFLGAEVTEELFRVTDASAKMMFESMKLAQNNDLSMEQMAIAQEQIQANLIEESLNIDNWNTRYSTFVNARSVIESASLDDTETARQITLLIAQHFNLEERQKMAYFGLDKP